MILDQVLLSLVLGINVLLGLAVWYRAPRKPVNVFFGLITVGIAIWGASSFYSQVTTDLHQSLALVRIAFEGAVMIGVCFAIFSLYFPKLAAGQDRRAKTISVVIAAAGVVVGWLLLQPSFIADVTRGSHSNSVVTGGAYVIFPLFFVLLVGSALGRLVLKLWGAKSGVERQQIGYVLLGFAISAVIGSLTNLILPLITGTNELAKYGPFATVAMAGSMAYAIAAHRLFNIRLLVARSIAFALLLTTLGVVYATTAFSVGDLFFSGSQTSTAREAYNVILALILAFTFQPLRRFFERITDRVFYRDRYDSQVVLNEFSQILVSELELDRILKRALSELCRMLHIQYGQIVVFHHDRVYRVQHHGPLPGRLMVAPQLRQLAHPLLVADELEPGELRSLMDDHGVRISLELNTREEHIGYLLLGDKLSGNIYSAQDIRLLEIIGKELAVAISNAKAYTEIQAFNITLQERVDRATNRLRVANRHLKELDKAKDEFISMASHQLRTPLTTIKGYMSMMLEGDAGKLTPTQTEFTNYAYAASERMVNLISDLLNVSRLSAGRFLIQTKPTDIVQMAADEVRQLQSHASAKRISLAFVPPAKPLPLVDLDDNKTRQVMMNFIDNAIYYTKQGSVTVNLSQAGDRVRLEVHDTGIGVPKDAQKKLFSKFYRAENAQTVRPDGTGLGLYLAKRVVEDQDGTIVFSSAEGKGSVFGFELPIKHVPRPTKAKAKEEKEPNAKP